ncbi:hypothetical protein V6L78_26915 [Pseudomonas canadensis]|uniref:hypothetical protein n=1 Tax=Pseudomonas canadensis TaxID=915099 RepID=UPI0030CDA083
MSDIFHDVTEQNAHACGHLQVEPGIQMPGRVLGVCIEVQDAYAPIFISAEQLRALADAAENQ